MKKKPGKKLDLNELAASIVDRATDENPSKPAGETKNPAAVALGRLGGLKGGKARAKALPEEERKRIAKGAALARWSKDKPNHK